MPKEYFSAEHAVNLSALPPGAKVHIIGVSGVAMAQLAVVLSEAGFEVSGSDKEFYEPMGSFLSRSKVRLCRGYAAENIPPDVSAVVIGNAVSYGHPEVSEVERCGYRYSFFPKLLSQLIIDGRHSIVVAGTHGKSTTTAMLATVLTKLGCAPSYFVGGVVRDLPQSLVRGGPQFSVVEGDEYDSAFFAKVPKFNFYKPDTFIITSIEYDHADIYPSLESINAVFTAQVLKLAKTATVLACVDFDNLRTLVAEWKTKAACRILTYGTTADADFSLTRADAAGHGQHLHARFSDGVERRWTLGIPGKHNALNSLAVTATAHVLALDATRVAAALEQFQGVKRRQEVRFNSNDICVVEDFAHHPTAVRETVAAIRQAYPGKRVWAVFEPRSNTSRRKVFQQPYVEAFSGADRAILCQVTARSNDTSDNLIDVSELGREIESAGVPCSVLPDASAIAKLLLTELRAGDVALIMSNGSFGGLIDALLSGLSARKP